MLKKLFLHDLSSTARTSAILYLSGLGAALFAMLIRLFTLPLQSEFWFMDFSASLFALLLCLTCILLPAAVPVVYLFYAYRTWFTDEGYLSFVLPANETEHLLSKFFVGAIWGVIAIPAAQLGTFISSELPYYLVYPGYNDGYVEPLGDPVVAILSFLLPYFIVVSLVMIGLFAIVAGCTLMPKAKTAGVILFAAAACITAGFGITLTDLIAMRLENYGPYPDLIAELVFFPGVAIASFFLSRLLLRRSLNLE